MDDKESVEIFLDDDVRIVIVFKREKKLIINFFVVLEIKGAIIGQKD